MLAWGFLQFDDLKNKANIRCLNTIGMWLGKVVKGEVTFFDSELSTEYK